MSVTIILSWQRAAMQRWILAKHRRGKILVDFLKQTILFFRISWHCELAEKERFIAPLCFASTLLLLFNFAFPPLDDSLKSSIFVAEIALTLLFSLQLLLQRSFVTELEDRALDEIRLSRASLAPFLLAKFLISYLLACILLCPVLFLGSIFLEFTLSSFHLKTLLFTLCALAGLLPLGLLLSLMTFSAKGKEFLFPLLFYPLSVPVLLALLEASKIGLAGDFSFNWFIILLCFDMIYCTLAFLFGPELLQLDL